MRYLPDVSRHTRKRQGVVHSMLTSKYRHGHSHALHTRLHGLLTKLDKLQVRVQPLLAWLAPLASRKLTAANSQVAPKLSCLIPPRGRRSRRPRCLRFTHIVSPGVIRRLSARGWKSRLYVEVMAKTASARVSNNDATSAHSQEAQTPGDKTRQSRCRESGGGEGGASSSKQHVRGEGYPPYSFLFNFSRSRSLSLCLSLCLSPTEINWGEPLSHCTPELQQSRGVASSTKVWKHAATENLQPGRNDCNVPL